MAFAISVKATDKAGDRLRKYWTRFSALEPAPSMAALEYPPHITLAVYDHIAEGRLRDALTTVFQGEGALRLSFHELRYFDDPQLVFWAAPAPSSRLKRLHTRLHDLIDPALCREHYRPGVWVPHATLATAVSAGNKARAIDLASQAIKPFEVFFDTADCVEAPPVRVIEERSLKET